MKIKANLRQHFFLLLFKLALEESEGTMFLIKVWFRLKSFNKIIFIKLNWSQYLLKDNRIY